MKHAKKRDKLLDTTRALLATLAQATPGTDLLQAGIEALAKLIQVKYGAIGVLDEAGNLTQFVYTGMSGEDAKRLSHPPKGNGLLGAIVHNNVALRLDNMADDPRSEGFPANHPHMTSLLAVPISTLDHTYGRIYLCDKFDKKPFSGEDEELALSFANAISLIMDNARKMNRLEQEQSHLVHTAFHDPLTKLPNRILLYDRMAQALGHANRSGTRLAILFCDLDGFKTINDTLGHQVGDHVLKTMGERFVNCVRENDTVARLGGDEFVFVLSVVESAEHAGTVAQKILNAISQQIPVKGHEVMLFGSIGIAIYPLDGDDPDCLMRKADIAMYKAKGLGKNNYQFFVEGLFEECAVQSGLLEHHCSTCAEASGAVMH